MDRSPVKTLVQNSSPTKVTILPPRYQIYCEDDYFQEECSQYYHPRCEQKVQELPTPFQFNYPRFTQYLKVKSEIEFKNRMAEAAAGIVSPGLDHFTDERLKEELSSIYGDMDESSERYSLIFENFKIQRLEQIKEWIEAASNSTNELVEIVENDESGFIEEEIELLKYFTLEEITKFESLSKGRNSDIEPFLLPRKKVKTLKNTNLDKTKQKRLSKYDTNADQLIGEVTRVISQYPFGLTLDLLLDKCKEGLDKKGYRGPAINSGMLERSPLKEIVFTKEYNSSYLAFPSALEPHIRSNPLRILWELKHRLLAILNLSYGIIGLNECVQLLNKIFQIYQFDCKNWGFQAEEEFVKVVFEKWKTENVEVLELPINGKTQNYLAVVTKKSNKLIEDKLPVEKSRKVPLEDPRKFFKGRISVKKQLQYESVQHSQAQALPLPSSHSTSPIKNSKFKTISSNPSSDSSSPWNKTSQPPPPSIPPLLNYDPSATSIDRKFVQLGEKMFQEQNGVKKGTQIGCVVSYVNSPTNFYLVRQVKWKELNALHDDLRNYWHSNPTAKWPHPKFLQKNYICMAKVDSEDEEDVYRVVLLGRPDPLHYKALCVDYGDLLTVTHAQLRYLPKDLFSILEAQAISCSIYNVASPQKNPATGEDVWNKEVCDFTRSLFLPKGSDEYTPTVKVLFKERVHGNGKWLVKVSTPKTPDFGEEIMKFVNRKK